MAILAGCSPAPIAQPQVQAQPQPQPWGITSNDVCRGDFGPDCVFMGRVTSRKLSAEDEQRALERWTAACKANDEQACAGAGSLLLNGAHVPHDPARGVALSESSGGQHGSRTESKRQFQRPTAGHSADGRGR